MSSVYIEREYRFFYLPFPPIGLRIIPGFSEILNIYGLFYFKNTVSTNSFLANWRKNTVAIWPKQCKRDVKPHSTNEETDNKSCFPLLKDCQYWIIFTNTHGGLIFIYNNYCLTHNVQFSQKTDCIACNAFSLENKSGLSNCNSFAAIYE